MGGSQEAEDEAEGSDVDVDVDVEATAEARWCACVAALSTPAFRAAVDAFLEEHCDGFGDTETGPPEDEEPTTTTERNDDVYGMYDRWVELVRGGLEDHWRARVTRGAVGAEWNNFDEVELPAILAAGRSLSVEVASDGKVEEGRKKTNALHKEVKRGEKAAQLEEDDGADPAEITRLFGDVALDVKEGGGTDGRGEGEEEGEAAETKVKEDSEMRRASEKHADVLDLLTTLTERDAFRRFVLCRKRPTKGMEAPSDSPTNEEDDEGEAAETTALEAELENLALLLETGEWASVRVRGVASEEITCARSRDSKYVDVFRLTADVPGLTADECLDMLFNAEPEERKHWDAAATWERLGDGTYAVSNKVPLLPAFKVNVRLVIKRDFPKPGDITYGYRMLDGGGELDFNKGATCGKGCITTIESGGRGAGESRRVRLTVVEELPSIMLYLPQLARNFVISRYAPRQFLDTLVRFKKYRKIG